MHSIQQRVPTGTASMELQSINQAHHGQPQGMSVVVVTNLKSGPNSTYFRCYSSQPSSMSKIPFCLDVKRRDAAFEVVPLRNKTLLLAVCASGNHR
eukprot:5309-Amphidinium_carterae.1